MFQGLVFGTKLLIYPHSPLGENSEPIGLVTFRMLAHMLFGQQWLNPGRTRNLGFDVNRKVVSVDRGAGIREARQ
jgi:hypothetical protein